MDDALVKVGVESDVCVPISCRNFNVSPWLLFAFHFKNNNQGVNIKFRQLISTHTAHNTLPVFNANFKRLVASRKTSTL